MSDLQSARATVESHLPRETTRQFDVALHNAAITSIESMSELRRAVGDCVIALKDRNVGPVQMILAIKTCALDSAARYHPELDEPPVTYVEVLMDQIVKWAITEYYGTSS